MYQFEAFIQKIWSSLALGRATSIHQIMHWAHMALEIGIILTTGIDRGENEIRRWDGERFNL